MPNHISTIQSFIFPLSTSGPAGFYCMYIVRNVHTPYIFMDSSYVLYVPAIYFLSLYLFVALRPYILHTNFVNNFNNPYMYCTAGRPFSLPAWIRQTAAGPFLHIANICHSLATWLLAHTLQPADSSANAELKGPSRQRDLARSLCLKRPRWGHPRWMLNF
jgi:hypothetical protein